MPKTLHILVTDRDRVLSIAVSEVVTKYGPRFTVGGMAFESIDDVLQSLQGASFAPVTTGGR